MRFTAGPALTGVAAILLSVLWLPEILPRDVGGRLAAQNDGAPEADGQPARDPTDEPIAVPAGLHPIRLTTSG